MHALYICFDYEFAFMGGSVCMQQHTHSVRPTPPVCDFQFPMYFCVAFGKSSNQNLHRALCVPTPLSDLFQVPWQLPSRKKLKPVLPVLLCNGSQLEGCACVRQCAAVHILLQHQFS
jgi:hypothetical protein